MDVLGWGVPDGRMGAVMLVRAICRELEVKLRSIGRGFSSGELDLVLLDLRVQCLETDTEDFRGFCLVPAEPF